MRFEFGEFTFDTGRRQLLAGSAEIHLSPKAFDLLRILVEGGSEARSKNELIEALWPDTFVDEGNLSVLVSEIRRALRDSAREPRFIRTVPRYGYAFAAEIGHESTQLGRPRSNAASHWLIWGHRKLELSPGEMILGRDPHCDVHLDVPGVSRRHARLLVGDGEVTLEDLASKNGTYISGERVAGSVALRDGNRVEFGPVELMYRRWEGPGSTVSLPDGRVG